MLKYGLSAIVMGAVVATSSIALAQAQQPQAQPGQEQEFGQPQQEAETRQLPQGASEVLNKQVFGATGEEVGQVRDVIISQDGSVEAVVIERGGVLGVGAQQVAIDWDQISLDPQQDGLSVDMTESQLSELPEYQEGSGAVVEEPPAAQQPQEPLTQEPPTQD